MSRIVGPMSVTCVNCERRPPLSLIRCGQRTTSGLRVPPRCEAICLPHWNGVLLAHAHADGVVRVHHLGTPRLQPAPLQRELHLFLVGQREAVEHRSLVERSGWGAFQAGAVIPPDPDHDRVIELAHRLDRVQQPADVMVGVLRVARVHLHLAREHALAVLIQRIPGGHRLVARREDRVGRDHAELLLALERLLAKLVPALIEPPLVLLRPLLPDVMRRMAATGRVVQAPRLLGVMAANAVQPVDRLVGHRLWEVERLAVLTLLNPDELLVLGDHRVELTGLGSQETPVVIEPPAVRPVVKRTGRALLLLRRQMPLTDRRRRVPVLLQHLRERRRVLRQHRRITGESTRGFGDAPHPHRVMVTPRQQRRPRRRAHRRHVETVVPQPLRSDPVVIRGIDRAAERARIAKAGVVDQHHQHVRSTLRRLHVPDLLPARLRTTERLVRDAAEGWTADR